MHVVYTHTTNPLKKFFNKSPNIQNDWFEYLIIISRGLRQNAYDLYGYVLELYTLFYLEIMY